SIGIIPAAALGATASKPGYPNPWIELPIFTQLPSGDDPLSRNHVNVRSADVVVLLPGGSGTAHEAALAIAYSKPPGATPGAPRGSAGRPGVRAPAPLGAGRPRRPRLAAAGGARAAARGRHPEPEQERAQDGDRPPRDRHRRGRDRRGLVAGEVHGHG